MENQFIPTPSLPRYVTEIGRDPNLRSDHSRKNYISAISQFETWRAGRQLSTTLLEEYLSVLQKRECSQSTVKLALSAIRWLAKRAVKIAYDEHPRAEAEIFERDIQHLLAFKLQRTTKPLPTGRHLDVAEVNAIISACDDGTLIGIRDAAIISVAISTAARNEEIRMLKLADLQYVQYEKYVKENGSVEYIPHFQYIKGRADRIDGAEITIQHGKGDKSRVVDLFDQPLERMTAWIENRGIDGEYIFTRIRRGDAVTTEPLTYEGTRTILKHRFMLSDLSKSMTWHDFRRTAIGWMLDDGNDPATIMDVTGHADFNTVKRYDRRPANLRKNALRKIQSRQVVE